MKKSDIKVSATGTLVRIALFVAYYLTLLAEIDNQKKVIKVTYSKTK